MTRCRPVPLGAGNINTITKIGWLREAVRLVAVSDHRAAPRPGAQSPYATADSDLRYISEFTTDRWGEHRIDNPMCIGNHRTHEAAVRCGQRFATLVGVVAEGS